MAVNGIEIEVGQAWITYAEAIVTIEHLLDGGKFLGVDQGGDTRVYDINGRSDTTGGYLASDLERLATEVPVVEREVTTPEPELNVRFADAVDDTVDPDALASETLHAMGWHFDGQCWVQPAPWPVANDVAAHPLFPVYVAAIEQAMFGKGKRHGGAVTPFLSQPWVHYVKMHGRGFATGQSAKKIEEAASILEGEAFEKEVLGGIVYAGMSILKERGAL